MRRCLTKFSRIFECGAVFLSDSKGAKVCNGSFLPKTHKCKSHKCKSCRSRQGLSNEYLVFTCKIRRRYSRERASQSLPQNSQQLEKKSETPEAATIRLRLRLRAAKPRDLVVVRDSARHKGPLISMVVLTCFLTFG